MSSVEKWALPGKTRSDSERQMWRIFILCESAMKIESLQNGEKSSLPTHIFNIRLISTICDKFKY